MVVEQKKSNSSDWVGSKTVQITDNIEHISFDTWLLYPCIDKPQSVDVGPYCINVCADGRIAKGEFPLVIISHGSGGSHLLYRLIALHLVKNGYIVAMLKHHANNRDDNSLAEQDKNLTLRTRHIRYVIDTLLSDEQWMDVINPRKIFMIGHSMGGCTALALAGATPWSQHRLKIDVSNDKRIRALVLLAPASAWYQHPNSFVNVNLPMLIFSAEHDVITPFWQADLIKQKVSNSALVDLKVIKNAGHFSFISPFPAGMVNKNFAASQDPEGFDRNAFHDDLKKEISAFFNNQLNTTHSVIKD
ncbi:alpha/beta hydrolase family protein [Psychromonas sp. CNPT3]|uniref:alpha/beta hydrolase family protein n=1 Tax=Psychromonas sp. CNPT3 TaxID=314282 RepID=UPI00006E428D|nr:alpha/beta fold hydrolase [Psychromonas sp. CNPT3]AGH80891.1 alpha/beta hydrolase family protein [Psychromonas sp. CNPT3]